MSAAAVAVEHAPAATVAVEDAPAEAAPAAPAEAPPAVEARSGWQTWEKEDVMTGLVTSFAARESLNSHEFGFPYQGGSSATLTLRRHPRHGEDVILSVTKGQILCSSFQRCTVMVRFDDLPPIRLRGAEPADHDSTTLFLEPAEKFIKAARQASKAAIELSFYREGSRVFLFDVEGLVWK
ncbi:MAG: hypothetical protein IPK80_30190 [Nannocystis sp.]|nr:hypothetical protein [Nannocystis sp.]